MEVVSFKKMRMRTTRRLDITNSRRASGTTFCCLAIVEPEYGGQQLLFGGHNFTIKNNRFGNGRFDIVCSVHRDIP